MTPGEAVQAQANREDGWPYPDNDRDIMEDRRAETQGPRCPHLANNYDDCWECWEDQRNGATPDRDLFDHGLSD